MNSIAAAFLVLLLIIVFRNWMAGTLGQWLRAKFFNDPGTK